MLVDQSLTTGGSHLPLLQIALGGSTPSGQQSDLIAGSLSGKIISGSLNAIRRPSL
jgi:hypothetical protein